MAILKSYVTPNVDGATTMGRVTLVAGSAVEAAVVGHTASHVVQVTRVTVGGGTPGILTAALVSATGVLTITSSEATDVPEVAWLVEG